MALLIVALIPGCEQVREKYGPRDISLPETLTAEGETGGYEALYDGPFEVEPASRQRPVDALTRPEFYPGLGRVVNQPLGDSRLVATAGSDAVTLNFVDTDIREVVDVVLSETLGLNYVIDARVAGGVTARTSRPIPRSAVLPVLENILALNGAALVQSGGIYNVVPVDAVASLPKVVVTPSTRPQRAGVGTHVIPVRHASVESLEQIATSMVSPGNQLAVDAGRNILIYTGPSSEAAAIADLVSVLDIDVLAGLSFALFPVESSNAEDIAAEMEALFSEEMIGDIGGVVRFLPITRLNAVLAVASRPEHLTQIGAWVTRLDRSDTAASQSVYVYYVKNGPASEMAEVMNQVFGSGDEPSRRPGRDRQGTVAPGLDAVVLESPAGPGDSPGGGEAGGLEPLPPTFDSFGFDEPEPRRDDGIRFVPDERNNAIVITATSEEYRKIETTLRQLDVPPLQVLIEATIVEVALNDDLEYGVQWFFESGDFSGSFASNLSGAVGPAFPGFNLVLDTSDVRVVLSALADVTDVKVVSSPQLMVLDNQSARLQVGDQVPAQTGEAVTDGGTTITSVEYFDTGVILTVTPRVSNTGQVTLVTELEVSDAIITESSAINSPTIQQRSIQTTISVDSGETVALGGLIRERAEDGESGIPLLKDIPLLGNAFKTTTRRGDRRELLILITPKVVRGAAQARYVTNELRDRISILRRELAPAN